MSSPDNSSANSFVPTSSAGVPAIATVNFSPKDAEITPESIPLVIFSPLIASASLIEIEPFSACLIIALISLVICLLSPDKFFVKSLNAGI